MKDKVNFLLDMDGVLCDFISGALKELNRKFNKSITLEQYVTEFGSWGTYDYYGITVEQFWEAIEENKNFWIELNKYPWSLGLIEYLGYYGNITILTAPSEDPDCSRQKYAWLNKYLNIKAADVIMGHKKYLLAGSGILIDDYVKNTTGFINAGGQAILIPSTWNTNNLRWSTIKNVIDESLKTFKVI